MYSVVVATQDVVGERMAGPGIRAFHLAQELGKHFPTTLLAQVEPSSLTPQPSSLIPWRSRQARAAIREASVLIGQPARGFRRFRPGQRMVYDLFDPVLLELREMYGRRPSPRQTLHMLAERWRLNNAMASGDLLICATPTQRELYDSSRVPIVEVPFGVQDDGAPPQKREDVIVWGGGTWEWLDPRTAVDAVMQLNANGVPCRLLFLGRGRPNPHLVDRRRENRFDELLRAGAPYVVANDGWVPYAERLTWLRRSKIAMMLHRPTAEARYSIRTRLFDAIAAGTPVIATEEGFAADLVAQEGLGLVVPPSNIEAVAGAVRRLLRDDAFHARCVSNLDRIRPRYGWAEVVRPLVDAVRRWQT